MILGDAFSLGQEALGTIYGLEGNASTADLVELVEYFFFTVRKISQFVVALMITSEEKVLTEHTPKALVPNSRRRRRDSSSRTGEGEPKGGALVRAFTTTQPANLGIYITWTRTFTVFSLWLMVSFWSAFTTVPSLVFRLLIDGIDGGGGSN